MRTVRLALILVALLPAGCGGGGGGGADLAPSALWGQFRQNSQRTGAGIGIVQDNDAIVDFEFVDERSAEEPIPSAISCSPAIDADGNLYIGSEGGTLAMFEGDDDLNRVWSVTRCGACPAGNRRLGRLVSSPAVYTFENIDGRRQTDLVIGSMDSAVFVFRFFPDQDPAVDEGDCSVCFWRGDESLQAQFLAGDPGARATAEFASSATFTTNLTTGLIAGIFIGARVAVEHSDGSTEVLGKLYAINNDGSLRWEFPRPGDPKIGPISSSPALAQGNTIYFTTDTDPQGPGGDVLYALTDSGSLKRSVWIPGLTDSSLLLSPSVISGATIFATGVNGVLRAMNADGTFRWNVRIPGERFTASLALGNQNLPTETPAPAATPTPTGTPVDTLATLTPTATETPLLPGSTLLGVTETGIIVAVDVRSGSLISPTGARPSAAVEGTVVSSPALSADLFLVYGTTGGQLFSVNTANGQLPRFCDGGPDDGALCTDNRDCVDGFCQESVWPLLLPRSCRAGERRAQSCSSDAECPGSTCQRPAIRSSPVIDLDGTVYFGADDGRVYAVAPLSEITPLPTATPVATLPRAPTATAAPRGTPTSSIDPTRPVAASPTPMPAATPSSQNGGAATAPEVVS